MEVKTKKLNEINCKKAIIFDSSTIITLNMIDMLGLLAKLKSKFNGEFLIPHDVYKEIVNVPIEIKKYELRALLVKKIILDGILEVVGDKKIEKNTSKVLYYANNLYSLEKNPIKIIHRGEASCIALYDELKIENKNKVIAMDERTTRMLLENPINLKKLLERKLHKEVEVKEEASRYFTKKNIRIIRSSEILYFGFIKNMINLINGKRKILDALLYGAKFYGCSISEKEINELKKKI